MTHGKVVSVIRLINTQHFEVLFELKDYGR